MKIQSLNYEIPKLEIISFKQNYSLNVGNSTGVVEFMHVISPVMISNKMIISVIFYYMKWDGLYFYGNHEKIFKSLCNLTAEA